VLREQGQLEGGAGAALVDHELDRPRIEGLIEHAEGRLAAIDEAQIPPHECTSARLLG
tara:strand:+ start:440 stop:613 length:174 start_codon:yes stop_codon:yes gene_type:complete